jgi:hypothetical protein
MGQFGGYFKGDKKKTKKKDLEKKAQKHLGGGSFEMPTVEIIKKGKKPW